MYMYTPQGGSPPAVSMFRPESGQKQALPHEDLDLLNHGEDRFAAFFRGNRLSNTTCLMRVFFKSDEYYSKLW